MKAKVGLTSSSMARWSLSLVLATLLWCSVSTARADGNLTIELADAAKTVFGSEDCARKSQVIALLWSLSPETSTTLLPTGAITVAVYLGDESSGIKLTEFNRTVGANEATQINQERYDGTINKPTTDQRKEFGLELNDNSLHAVDVIGYHRTKVQPPAPSDVCALESVAGSDNPRKVTVTFVANYRVIETDNTNPAAPTTREVSQKATGTIELEYDLQAPKSVSSVKLTPYEKRIQVTWEGDTSNKHSIVFSKTKFDAKSIPSVRAQDQNIGNLTHTLTGLEQKTQYYIAVLAVDDAGNESVLSEVQSVNTQDLTDFYEYYRSNGGKDGGFNSGVFCFIATAAYGHYDHSFVRVLRRFRDVFLLSHGPGRAFVAWYYRNSPAWAAWLRRSPKARWVVRVSLAPVVVAAYVLLRPVLLLVVFSLLVLLFWARRHWRRKAAVVVALLCFVSPSWSDAEELVQENLSSPRRFNLELRVGPYRPLIDSEAGLSATKPFEKFFNNAYQPYFEVGFEWMFFKRVGSLGLNASAGFSWAAGNVLDADGNPVTSGSSTSGTSTSTGTDTAAASTTSTLWVLPLRLDLVYRFDYYLHRSRFPLVPYARAGLDYFLWFVTDPSGAISTSGTDTAFGGRFGFHVSVGLQLELNFIDPVAARTFDVEVGVNHTFLFVEWNSSWVGIVSDGLNLSDHMVRFGLMFQI